MFVSKIGDIISCDNGVYEVIHQFTYNGEEFVLLSTLSASFIDVLTEQVPVYIAKELVSKDGEQYALDFSEDKKLIKNIIEYLKQK